MSTSKSTTSHVRTAPAMSDAELRASAMGRISALAARHGHNSPQVTAALARWARIDAARVDDAGLMDLVSALGVAR